MKKAVFILLISVVFALTGRSGNGATIKAIPDSLLTLKPGLKIPDLEFSNITNTDKEKVRISDYAGKLLILDFWGTYCGPCIAAMPKLNDLQKEFAEDMQILLVSTQKQSLIEQYFKRAKTMQSLDLVLPSLYEDRTLYRLFPHLGVPHYVWIDQTGTILANSSSLTRENIENAIRGKRVQVTYTPATTARADVALEQRFFNELLKKPVFVHEGKNPEGMAYKSVLTGFIDSLSFSGHSRFVKDRLVNVNASVFSLYGTAYGYSFADTGEPVPNNRIFLETALPDRYKYPEERSQRREWMKTNTYCHDIVLTDYPANANKRVEIRSRKFMREVLKQELDEWSGLVSGIEKRTVPCLVLKCTDSSKINSPENLGSYTIGAGMLGGVFSGIKMSRFLMDLRFYLQKKEVLIDETGYTGSVNLEVNCPLYDTEKLSEALKKYGLILTREVKEVDVLVLRDR